MTATGRIAAALGVEGGHAIENDLGKLEELYRRGVRYMGLTWNNTHDWADAAKEETLHGTRHNGLTKFGEEVVGRMNDLGMIVDIRCGSNDSDQTISNAVGCSGSDSSCTACRRNSGSSIV